MAMERTYIMLKPDCVRRGLMGEVIARIEREGFAITEAKMMRLDEAILREHYAHLTENAVILGFGDKAEIWDADTYDKMEQNFLDSGSMDAVLSSLEL